MVEILTSWGCFGYHVTSFYAPASRSGTPEEQPFFRDMEPNGTFERGYGDLPEMVKGKYTGPTLLVQDFPRESMQWFKMPRCRRYLKIAGKARSWSTWSTLHTAWEFRLVADRSNMVHQRKMARKIIRCSKKYILLYSRHPIHSIFFGVGDFFSTFFPTYPLVMTYIAMENHHVKWENPLFLWSFSIVMRVITRGYVHFPMESHRCSWTWSTPTPPPTRWMASHSAWGWKSKRGKPSKRRRESVDFTLWL